MGDWIEAEVNLLVEAGREVIPEQVEACLPLWFRHQATVVAMKPDRIAQAHAAQRPRASG